MTQKFIALRRSPRSESQPRNFGPIEDVRAAQVAAAHTAATHEQLAKLGLKLLDPCVPAPDEDNSFWPLDYLDAFVVETTNSKLGRKVRDALDEKYMIVPNVELSLPLPERGRIYKHLPKIAGKWPAESGIYAARQLGLTGKGVRVCVLDTGVDADHAEFRGKVIDFRYVPLEPKTSAVRDCRAFDVDGHGTHVCGVVAGRHVGVAPDAELMVAAVLESETLKTSLERVVVALNWVLSQFEDEANLNKPFIVNMSLGFTRAALDRTGFESAVEGFQQIIATLVHDFKVLPIVAVGNDGPGSLRAPAYFENTLSVGAVDFANQVATFSGGGKSPITDETEPNLVGYGVDVLSSFERTRYNRSTYRYMSGTSMAAPYVTGIAALYAAQNPEWQGMALWERLVNSALPIDEPADRVGAGLARFDKEANR